MAYRDELEAARARIEALEERLAGADDVDERARRAIAKSAEAEAKLAALTETLAELTRRHEALLAAVQSAPAGLETLVEHARRTPPGENALSGTPAGVTCPLCLLICGDRVEMRIHGTLRMVLSQSGATGSVDNTVRCPRCDYVGIKI